MTFPSLFLAYLAIVALAAAAMARQWLVGRARLATIVLLIVWLAYAGALGVTGVVGQYNQLPPGLVFLTVPIILTLLALTLTAAGAHLARQFPLPLLFGFQVFRVGVEISLHHLVSLGYAPRIMTLEGGNFEIVVAVTAPVAAWIASGGSTTRRRIAWAWNLIGLLSLGNVIVRAVLSTPGQLHLIQTEVPDTAILLFPFTFIPGFMAPLALAIHILAFRALSLRTRPV